MNLITAPDTLQNDNPSILLVNPSNADKEQFNSIAKDFKSNINLYLFQEEIPEDTDQWLIGWMLKFNKTFYLTTADHMSYNSINVNKVYDMTQVAEGVNYFEV